MNLCGGFTNISEPELVFQIQDEEYDMTPSTRRKKTSSSGAPNNSNSSGSSHRRSSSRGRERSSSSTTATAAASTMLNPVSKDDIKKIQQYRQQRPRPAVVGMKSSSILMKKLDSGFNVVSFLRK